MRIIVTSIYLVFVLSLVTIPLRVEAAHEPAGGAVRALLVTGGHAFEEKPLMALFDAIPDVEVTHVAYPAAAEMLNPELAKEYDVLVFYDLWHPELTLGQRKALLQLLNQGIGVVALHHTIASHPNWPEYAKIIGGKYFLEDRTVDGKTLHASRAIHGQDIPVRVVDPHHPITHGLSDFEIHDETYGGCQVDPSVHLLLATDHPDNNKQLAWVKTYGKSRVFYLQLGHDHFAYEHPSYRKLVARGIRWTAESPVPPKAETTAIFNGKDLTGWVAEGNALWEVEDGQLIGRQGPGNSPGDLFTEASYGDFELTVTYKIDWPANSGVWYRYQSPGKAYQADILEYKSPVAYSGSLYSPGKLFLAINDDPELVNREGWNRLVIRVVGDRHVIMLNGKQVADVRDGRFKRGRIGLQVHPGAEFGAMRIAVKEMRIREL